MKLLMSAILLVGLSASAASKTDDVYKTYDFSGVSQDITSVVKRYSDISGDKFILDGTVKGKISLLLPKKVTKTEAFYALAKGLSMNGYTYVKHEGYYTIRRARNAQRSNIEVTTTLPSANPVRLVTYIYKCKYVKCAKLFGELRVFNSKDGESHVDPESNQIVISDYSDHLQKVAKILDEVDVD